MHQNHLDTLARIEEPPVWWDVNGAPHWDQPRPDDLKDMRRIKCQECARVFWVKLTDCYGYFQADSLIREVPKFWHYGDPPNHEDNGDGSECHAGYCMNSIPEYEWGVSPEQEAT